MAEIRPVFKARVSSIEGHAARVIPLVGGDVVTRPLPLLWTMRDGMCPLAVGDLVVCVRFEDGDGIVLCRADGEWSRRVPYDVTVEGALTVTEDATAAGVSVSTHTHTAPHGETGGPH